MALDYATHTNRSCTARDIVELADKGEIDAIACLTRYADRLARGLASVINILDPEVIVLGGGLSQVQELYRIVPQLWTRYVFSDVIRTRLLPPAHGDSSGVLGAARLWPTDQSPS